MTHWFYSFIFILGLSFGSFINVLSLRYELGQKLLGGKVIGGRSRCPNCQKKLAWYELIPVFSFILQGGRCRNCRHRLSWQYPIVEILSGAIFTIVPWYLNNFQLPISNFQIIAQLPNYQLLITVLWLLIFLSLLLLSLIDFRLSIIPNQINLFLAAMGLAVTGLQSYAGNFSLTSGSSLGYYAGLFGFRENIWLNHLFAAALASLFFWLIVFFSRSKAMGWGDVKLAFALGLIFGWPDILAILTLAFFAGALVGIILIIRGRKNLKSLVPFGPFLAIGSALTFFLGFQLINGYFRLFGLL